MLERCSTFGELWIGDRARASSVGQQSHALRKQSLLAEAQFDPELAKAFRENRTLPRRKLVSQIVEEAIRRGKIRDDVDIEAATNALYALSTIACKWGLLRNVPSGPQK
jgi:hypothetical protein